MFEPKPISRRKITCPHCNHVFSEWQLSSVEKDAKSVDLLGAVYNRCPECRGVVLRKKQTTKVNLFFKGVTR